MSRETKPKLFLGLPCNAILAVVVCLCASIARRYCVKTAKLRITQTTPHDSPWSPSFLMPKISENFEQDHPLRGRQRRVG